MGKLYFIKGPLIIFIARLMLLPGNQRCSSPFSSLANTATIFYLVLTLVMSPVLAIKFCVCVCGPGHATCGILARVSMADALHMPWLLLNENVCESSWQTAKSFTVKLVLFIQTVENTFGFTARQKFSIGFLFQCGQEVGGILCE